MEEDQLRYLLGGALIAASLTVLVAQIGGGFGVALEVVVLGIGVWIVADRRLAGRIPYFRPQLSLYYDETATGDLLPLHDSGGMSYWIHLSLANTGRLAATGCECWLDGLSVLRDGSFVPHPYFRVESRLAWAHESTSANPYRLSIPPGKPRRSDLLYGEERHNGVKLAIQWKPGSVIALPGGTLYRVNVTARSRNTASVKKTFELGISTWDSMSVKEV
jgi:hypothetical protein